MEAILVSVDDLVVYVLDLVNHLDNTSKHAVLFHIGTHINEDNARLLNLNKVARLMHTPGLARTVTGLANHFH
jgi:hypothetical protein